MLLELGTWLAGACGLLELGDGEAPPSPATIARGLTDDGQDQDPRAQWLREQVDDLTLLEVALRALADEATSADKTTWHAGLQRLADESGDDFQCGATPPRTLQALRLDALDYIAGLCSELGVELDDDPDQDSGARLAGEYLAAALRSGQVQR